MDILIIVLFTKPNNKKENVCQFICVLTKVLPQSAITCSKLTRETLEHGVKYVQS